MAILILLLLMGAVLLAAFAGVANPADPWPLRSRLLAFALACFFLAELLRAIPAITGGH